MTILNVLQFMRKTSGDAILQKQLEALMGAGDGNISSAGELDDREAQVLKGERGILVTEFANRKGFEFSKAELDTVIDAFDRYQSGELSFEQLSEVLGLSELELQPQDALPSMKKSVKLLYYGIPYHKSGGTVMPADSPPNEPQTYRGAKIRQTQGETSIDRVLQFMQKTSSDAILQKQLEALMGTGDGNISGTGELDVEEARALKGERGVLVTEFANQKGFAFSKADLDTVVDAFGRHQSGELSLGQLSAVLGLSESELQPKDALPSMEKSVKLLYRGIPYHKSGGTVMPADSPPNKPQTYRGAKIRETQGATTIDRVLQFMQKTSSDAILQKQLEALMGTGDGNISGTGELDVEEARALKGERGVLVTEFANQKGFAFSKADLETVVDAFERYRAGVLSEEDLGKVLGRSDVNRGSLQKAVSLVY